MDPRCIGTCAMTAQDWVKCGMYNEEMEGYGYDDADIMLRAQTAGIETNLWTIPKVYYKRHEKHTRDTINPLRREENKKIGRSFTHEHR